MKKNNLIKLIFLLISIFLFDIYLRNSLLSEFAHNFEFAILILLIGILYIKLYSKHNIKNSYKQLEILITLYNDLNISKIMPETNAMDGYAANPDFLIIINNLIKKYKPSVIVEAGSGVSTLIAGYSLKKYSKGKIFSFDHDKKYANYTKEKIQEHQLQENAEVLFSKLINYEKKYLWYDVNLLEKIKTIDLLIIDGPPSKVAKNARYPAIPLLLDKLNKGSMILFDDCKRIDEIKIINIIKSEYNCFKYEYINNAKGAYLITKIT